MVIHLRPATTADAQLLLDIERRTLQTAYAHIFDADEYPFPEQTALSEWRSLLASETARTVVAEVDGAAVGTVSVDPPLMLRLLVLPEAQRHHIGSMLHDWAVDELGDTAELLVLRDNAVAREFYERRGWQQYGPPGRSAAPPHPPLLTYRLVR